MEWLLGVAALMVVIGCIGTVIPGLPGTTLVLGGLIVGAYADGFTRVGWGTLAVLGVLTVVSFGVEFLATMMGARSVGASKLALVGAALGTLGGLALGIVGVLIGPFIGAVAGELLHRKMRLQQNPREAIGVASKVGVGAWIGLMVGTVAKLVIVGLMIGLFLVMYFAK